jgi:hypothetical protein
MNCKKLFLIILAATYFLACNNKGENKQALVKDINLPPLQEPQNGTQKEKGQDIPIGQANQPNDSSESMPVASSAKIDWDKKIVKNATLKFEVKDFKSYAANVYRIVKQSGGYIASENQDNTEEKIETVITVKVPVDQFENMLSLLPVNEVKVIERNITTQDVSGEVVDIKARLEAKKQMRQKYMEFFKQAKNMEEVLQVQSEINSLHEIMESAAGRVNYLNNASAMSTVNLTFYQPLQGYQPTTGEPGFPERISSAFKTGAKWMGDIVVGFISIWPLLPIVLILMLAYKKLSRAKAKPANS